MITQKLLIIYSKLNSEFAPKEHRQLHVNYKELLPPEYSLEKVVKIFGFTIVYKDILIGTYEVWINGVQYIV